MSNELIFLRFYGEISGTIPDIRPQMLSAICSSIERIYSRSSSVLRTPISIELYFARPPAIGCLEIVLRVQSSEPAVPPPDGPLDKLLKSLNIAKDIATVGGALWLIVFGDSGLVDLVHYKLNPTIDTPIGQAAKQLSEEEGLSKEVQTLLNSASSSGAHKVEIELPDGTKATLFMAGEKADAKLIARTAYRSNDKLESRPKSGTLRRYSQDILRGRWDDKPARIFIAHTEWHVRDGPTSYVIVWTSSKPIPEKSQEAQYQGYVASDEDRYRLNVEDEVPESFQHTSGILVVERVADWG